jgi:nicotinate-nucleotide adenylyltransferase
MDAFRDIATWYHAEALLRECEFVVFARPGWSLREVTLVLPPGLRRSAGRFPRRSRGAVRVDGAVIHLLGSVRAPISATQVRAAARRGKLLAKLVPSSVAQYIKRNHLYRA